MLGGLASISPCFSPSSASWASDAGAVRSPFGHAALTSLTCLTCITCLTCLNLASQLLTALPHFDADHFDVDPGQFGIMTLDNMGQRGLPPLLRQMQPTGMDAHGDEGRRQALEAATVARAEGEDWSSIAQYLRESPPAGSLSSEERQVAERFKSGSGRGSISMTKTDTEPFDARECAPLVHRSENLARVRRAHPHLSVSWTMHRIMPGHHCPFHLLSFLLCLTPFLSTPPFCTKGH
jgi:hypothetical protein